MQAFAIESPGTDASLLDLPTPDPADGEPDHDWADVNPEILG